MKTVPQQITNLLFTKLKMDHIAKMTDEELIFFYGLLDVWRDRLQDRINTLSYQQNKAQR